MYIFENQPPESFSESIKQKVILKVLNTWAQ